jgi:MFS family permease
MNKSLKGMFSLYRGLPASVYTLFIAHMVNGIGIFVIPFTTLFLTKKLGMSEGYTGNFMFLTSIVHIPGILLGGRLADRYGRKKVMMVSQLLSGLMYIPCGFLGTSHAIPYFILASLFFDGITDPARQAMSADVTNPENRQAAFSLLYLGHNIGFAVGPVIAGFLFNNAPQWLFFGNAIAILAALTLVMLFIAETKPSKEVIEASYDTASTESAHRGGLFSALRSRPFLLIYMSLATWFGFVYAQQRFALPLQTEAFFGAGGAPLYGDLMTTNAVVVILFTTPLLALTKSIKPVTNVAIASVLLGAGFGMIALIRSAPLFFLSTILWTLGEILCATNEQVYIANHTPLSHRGRFNSILPLVGGTGFAISSPIIGRMIENRGLSSVWPLLALIGFATAGGLLILGLAEARTGRKTKGGPDDPNPRA